jgi:hypothetical protein
MNKLDSQKPDILDFGIRYPQPIFFCTKNIMISYFDAKATILTLVMAFAMES